MCRAPTLGLSIFFGCHHLYKAPIWWNYSLIHLSHLPIPHIMSNIQHRCRCPCGAHNKIDIQQTPSQLNWYMAGNEINIKTPEDLKYQWKRFPKMALQHKQKRSASSRQNLREKSLNAWHGILRGEALSALTYAKQNKYASGVLNSRKKGSPLPKCAVWCRQTTWPAH